MKKKQFIVRTSCEYSMVVEAESEEDALRVAEVKQEVCSDYYAGFTWDTESWSEWEAEEIGSEVL